MVTPIKVLFLEDNQDDAELLLIELETNGFDVDWVRVENEDQYLNHLSPELDMILADYTLPQYDAPAALTHLREKNYDVPFIIVAGSISEEVAVAMIKQGAADYLIKDRLSRLGEAVRHALVERKLRQEKRQAERDLRMMDWAIQSSTNAMAMADLQGQITFVNDAFVALWGHERREQVYGTSLMQLWADESVPNIEQALRDHQNLQGEMNAYKRNGTAMVLQYSTSTVLDEQRSPICMMAIFIDITERKRAQEAEREAEILRIQLEKEKELRDLKSRFMSMVIHDFRNPLSVMQLQLDALLVYADRLTAEKKEARINLALSQIQHLNMLMDDVLAISKMEYGAARFRPDKHDIVAFCRQIVDELHESLGDSHILLYSTELQETIIPFDPNLMRRAIANLLSNAFKYSPEASTVSLNITAHNGRVMISVADDGIGIPEDDQKWLFDPFHRAGNVGTIEGTGLGLPIVKQIAELHGGSIEFTSQLNQGAIFTLTLPCETC